MEEGPKDTNRPIFVILAKGRGPLGLRKDDTASKAGNQRFS